MGGWTHPLPQPLSLQVHAGPTQLLPVGTNQQVGANSKATHNTRGVWGPSVGVRAAVRGPEAAASCLEEGPLSCSLEPPEEAGRTPCGGKHLEAGGKCEAEARPAR